MGTCQKHPANKKNLRLYSILFFPFIITGIQLIDRSTYIYILI